MAQPYPPIEPYRTQRIKVSALHEIYVEESGNPQGKPVVFVHGGPGGGCEAWHRQFFDPRRYRIVLFDQRGCGRNQHLVQGHGSLRAREIRNAGAMHFSGGAVQLFGSVYQQAGASLVVSGGSVASVHGSFDAAAGSQTRVSDGSQLVFFGTVSQHVGASFSGGGRFLFEGGVSVGDSPGAGGVVGDAVLGQDSLFRAELAGLAPGTGFDHFTVSGHLQLGGTLQLSLLNGFAPQAGQRFDLFDWGSSSGSFAKLDLAAAPLAPGLRWDTSQLHIDGSLAVAAVPEPAHWALLASGLVVLFCRRRAWRAAA